MRLRAVVVAGFFVVGGALACCGQASSGGVGAKVGPDATKDAQPMAAGADPSFEVATIRPSDPDHRLDGVPFGHRSVFAGMTLRFLIAFVYDVHDRQIVDAPAWIGTKRFDIVGVADTPGTPDLEQLKSMERKLLLERFGLKFHWEERKMPAYVLTVAKGGAKLARSSDVAGSPSFLGRPDVAMKGRNLTMTHFAQLLQSGIMDRPVVDRTGLEGRYDFVLSWTPDQTEFGGRFPVGAETADSPPGLFTAMPEQLGLKLSAEKDAAVKVMVVDRVEQPSPN
ncbi:MAG: TIGR03435 family protein [Acidobacteriaceae bacterium]